MSLDDSSATVRVNKSRNQPQRESGSHLRELLPITDQPLARELRAIHGLHDPPLSCRAEFLLCLCTGGSALTNAGTPGCSAWDRIRVEYSLSHFHQVPPVNSASHSDICILVGIELIYRFKVGSSYVWGSLWGQLWAIELLH